jgi:hypothetical protein
VVVICYATAPLIASRWLNDVPATGITAVSLTVTALLYLPFGAPGLEVPSGRVVLAVAVLTLACTVAALLAFFALIAEAGPQRALVITFVNPAVALLLGIWLLSEPLTLARWSGFPHRGRLRSGDPCDRRLHRGRRGARRAGRTVLSSGRPRQAATRSAMDEIDQQVVSCLLQDARATYNEIGKVVGLSAPAVKRRVDRLVARGAIRGSPPWSTPRCSGGRPRPTSRSTARGRSHPLRCARACSRSRRWSAPAPSPAQRTRSSHAGQRHPAARAGHRAGAGRAERRPHAEHHRAVQAGGPATLVSAPATT